MDDFGDELGSFDFNPPDANLSVDPSSGFNPGDDATFAGSGMPEAVFHIPDASVSEPSAPTRPSLGIATTASTKLPKYAWVVIAIVAFFIIVAAILVPVLLLTNKSTTPVVTVTPVPSPPIRPEFAAINPSSLRQLAVPASDGLAKATAGVLQTAGTNIGFVLCGRDSKTAYYAFDTSAIQISLANVLVAPVAPGTTTAFASVFGLNVLAMDGTNWFLCQSALTSASVNPASVPVPPMNCGTAGITWPGASSTLNTHAFAGAVWTPYPEVTSVFSFSTANAVTYQNRNNVICSTSSTPIPNLTDPATQVLSMFYTNANATAIFGFAESVTNAVWYVQYSSAVSPDCATNHKIGFDDTAETIVYADMTYGGEWMVVLTNARLVVYNRTDVTQPFVVTDSLLLSSTFQPSLCAIDRLWTPSDALAWISIGTESNESVIIPLDTKLKRLVIASGRTVPTQSALLDTVGPTAVRAMPSSSTLFLLQCDSAGHSSVCSINTANL